MRAFTCKNKANFYDFVVVVRKICMEWLSTDINLIGNLKRIVNNPCMKALQVKDPTYKQMCRLLIQPFMSLWEARLFSL